MKLDHLYSLRRNFIVIGLTGRTGSGCTKVSEMLSGSFEDLQSSGLRESDVFTDKVFERKYVICKDFLSYPGNWEKFDVIKYVHVLLFYILTQFGGDITKTTKLLTDFFKEDSVENNETLVENVLKEILHVHKRYKKLIQRIKSYTSFKELKSEEELLILNEDFFGAEFQNLAGEMLASLEKQGYYRTRAFLHRISCHIRASGDPLNNDTSDIKYIYTIADLMNRLIKAKRAKDKKDEKPTRIVIDSLRNSLEIMFFKQRFSAFYMIATKDVLENAEKRIEKRLESKISDENDRKRTVKALLTLDEIEYRTKDFSKGKFSSPDVENCIQKSDYHLLNLRKDQIISPPENPNGFLSREEQLMKLIALIQQPGLITPSSAERAMQMANTARLNSGCISRKVGAAITDSSFFIKAIGWNDVAKGHTPCNLRSITDFFDDQNLSKNIHYSDFEKGKIGLMTSYKYKGGNPGNFKDAMKDYFQDSFDSKKDDLAGKNCSFCFKSVHNHYEGEANQVHTRSLHAEENAMLQITKLGGVGAEGGYLFTTASPCELCSKKAYQLGITKIFYIDPYPGIAVDQILKGGSKQPVLIPFSGAIGNAYDWLYDSFMSYKDELTMTLDLKPKPNISKGIKHLLQSSDNEELKFFADNHDLNDEEIKNLLLAGLKMKMQK